MTHPVIDIANIGKAYRVGGKDFWALRDITLRVQHGEVVGIVGRNGAGKTTLLRILSRITEPTAGRAVVRGRIGTLLETGTGFHDDLSGRENVYLNGAILGMKAHEIRSKFNEIVEFSGVGRFIDSAIKSYSSGMRSRLAFSVAAHLNTDVLLVDEVLAVGDLAFQEKCLRKMDELTHESDRTILFVSHSMGAIQSLCDRAILIENGVVAEEGKTEKVINAYYQLMTGATGQVDMSTAQGRPGSGKVRITGMRLEDLQGISVTQIPAGAGARIVFDYRSELPSKPTEVILTAVVTGSKGVRLFGMPSDVVRSNLAALSDCGAFVCTIPRVPLLPGTYEVTVSIMVDRELADKVVNVCRLHVGEGDPFGTARLQQGNFGDLWVDFGWSSETTSLLPATTSPQK
jgi:lipopolysaccharide transport system ATP-binding protein